MYKPKIIDKFMELRHRLRTADVNLDALHPLAISPEECDDLLRYLQPWQVDCDAPAGKGEFMGIKCVVVDPDAPDLWAIQRSHLDELQRLREHYERQLRIRQRMYNCLQSRLEHVLSIASQRALLTPGPFILGVDFAKDGDDHG